MNASFFREDADAHSKGKVTGHWFIFHCERVIAVVALLSGSAQNFSHLVLAASTLRR